MTAYIYKIDILLISLFLNKTRKSIPPPGIISLCKFTNSIKTTADFCQILTPSGFSHVTLLKCAIAHAYSIDKLLISLVY